MKSKTIHRFCLPISDEEVLKNFIKLAFDVEVPDTQVCQNHSTPWRAFCDAYFARSESSVWKASRGFGGKSFLLSLLGITEALTLKADTNVLGGSGEQSERVLEHMKTLLSRPNAPRHMIASDIAHEITTSHGTEIRSLMASSKSVRGPHPQRLRIDEVDECDIEIVEAALGQPMSKNGIAPHVVLSSTHHYVDGSMTKMLERAADRGWSVHEWCLEETRQKNGGWLSELDIERAKSRMSYEMWQNEVLLQEPSPDSRAIMPSSVNAMFSRELGHFAGAPREYIEIEPPSKTGEYTHGADWAKEKDWTIITTLRIDCDPARVVAFERLGREPYPSMIVRFDDRVKRYGGIAFYDMTGLGGVVRDLITVDAYGVIISGRNRSDMISDYIGAIERGKIVSPFITYMELEHKLASREIYRSGDEHLPDTIAAGALAWMARGDKNSWSGGSL